MSVVVSFRIGREFEEGMDGLKYIDWSKVVRRAIYEVVCKVLRGIVIVSCEKA